MPNKRDTGWAQQNLPTQYSDIYQGGDFTTGHGSAYGIAEIIKEAYIDDRIYRIGMDLNFLDFFCNKNSITVDQTLYTHLDEKPRPHILAVSGTVGAGTKGNISSLTVKANGQAFLERDLWMNESTKEVFQVTAVPVGNTVSIRRGYGTQPNKAMSDGQVLRRLGNALSETDTPGKDYGLRQGHSNNTVQKFSHVIGVTEMLRAQGIRTDDVLARKRRNTLYEHLLAKESQFIFGQFVEDMGGLDSNLRIDDTVTDWKGQTRGFLSYIDEAEAGSDYTTNILDAGKNLTFDDLSQFLYDINKNRRLDGSTDIQTEAGAPKKTMGKYNLAAVCGFEGKRALGWLQRKNDIQVKSMEKQFGFDIETIQTEGGMIDIYVHNLLDQGYAGHILLIDRNRIRTVKYKNHFAQGKAGLKVREITMPNEPGYQEELYEVCGFELMNPECHGYIYNV